MYRKILLAYDGSTEGRRALREGAALARHCNADVFLLAVVDTSAGLRVADGVHGGMFVEEKETYEAVLAEGVEKLRAMGFVPQFRLGWGQPGPEIVAVAEEIKADLVVAGHRHKGALAQWWSGSIGIYLIKNLRCSLLIGQTEISDDQFAKLVSAGATAA